MLARSLPYGDKTVNLDQRIQSAKENWKALQEGDDIRIYVGSATCGLAAGARGLIEALPGALAELGLEARVVPVGGIEAQPAPAFAEGTHILLLAIVGEVIS